MAGSRKVRSIAVPSRRETARGTHEPAPKREPVAKSETAPKPEPSDPNDLIAELEAQVAAAEARAKEAEDEALHLSPEANDLRARLARSAAKKKFGPSG